MSSATKSSQPPLPQSEITTKKKFGKNLNKLTRPPPQTSTASSKSSSNSRNGLLLLSTKRPSSGTNAASAGGILASKSASGATAKPLPSLGLQNKSSTSTHDALLGAVVGASRAELQEPDAWGVAEKQKSPTNESDSREAQQGASESTKVPIASSQEVEPSSGDYSSPDRHQTELPSSNWDQYGGRDMASNGNQGLYNPASEAAEDEQKSLMARMAKERAEKKWAEEEARQIEQRERATRRLRELEEKMVAANEGDARREQTAKARTLFDPSKPSNISYSASAGGSKDTGRNSQTSSNIQNGRSSNGTYSQETQLPETQADNPDAYTRQPVIQLASYDDRDRGERGPSAAPRMLYDPKSGSMVAVPSRDDSVTAGRGKKERGKKAKNPRDKESKPDVRQENEGAKGPRKGKQREKKGIDIPSPAKLETRKGKLSNERKLPRTCGVLYTRDNKGNFISSDGCDGDLGYGAHSVPGGRMKNADVYSKYVEQQKRTHQGDSGGYNTLDTSFESDMNRNIANEEIMLQTGFNVPKAAQVKFDWVKASDRIELMTGVEDSPTLQATAKEWAPSQAALAAAAARFEAGGGKEKVAPSASSDEDEDDEDDDGPFGLGFDPTLNMDSMMHSPSAEPAHGLAAVDLTSLSLEPAYQGPAKTNHIFAFGAGSTWGSSDAGGNSDTWGAPSSSSDATTFLSLSSGKTWGGISAFGGALGGSSLNGDHPRSTGD